MCAKETILWFLTIYSKEMQRFISSWTLRLQRGTQTWPKFLQMSNYVTFGKSQNGSYTL